MAKIPIHLIILLFNSFFFEKFINGIKSHITPARPKANIPKTSPSINNMLAGSSFNVSNINIKYHSGLIPIGAEANASAFKPNSQGKNRINID